MNRQWKLLTGALAILPTLFLFSSALAGESPNYRSYPQVLDNGGGKPASTNYQAKASIGQEVLGPSKSADYAFHAGYLYGAYAHPSPKTSKNMAISRLEAVKSLIPEKDWKKVDKAIEKIEESLNPLWWIDPWHLNQEKGKKKGLGGPGSGELTLGYRGGEEPVILGKKRYGEYVFKKEKEAAKKVKDLAKKKKKKYPPEAIEELIAVLWNIVDADSTLAQVKIVEAKLSGGNEKELKKARKEMEKAEKEKNKKKPKYEKVVKHYGKAWVHAVKAEEKGGGHGGVQVASLGKDRPVFALGKPYPNPSRSGSSIRYGIAEECRVSLKIYDVSGRLVRAVVDGEKLPGYYACEWDGKDGRGVRAASGTYIYRLIAGPFVARRKVVVLK